MVMLKVVNWGKTISFVSDLLAFIHTLQLDLPPVCAVPSQRSYNHKNPQETQCSFIISEKDTLKWSNWSCFIAVKLPAVGLIPSSGYTFWGHL